MRYIYFFLYQNNFFVSQNACFTVLTMSTLLGVLVLMLLLVSTVWGITMVDSITLEELSGIEFVIIDKISGVVQLHTKNKTEFEKYQNLHLNELTNKTTQLLATLMLQGYYPRRIELPIHQIYMARTLQRRHVQITLSWGDVPDLDLLVYYPHGNCLVGPYGDENCSSISGGLIKHESDRVSRNSSETITLSDLSLGVVDIYVRLYSEDQCWSDFESSLTIYNSDSEVLTESPTETISSTDCGSFNTTDKSVCNLYWYAFRYDAASRRFTRIGQFSNIAPEISPVIPWISGDGIVSSKQVVSPCDSLVCSDDVNEFESTSDSNQISENIINISNEEMCLDYINKSYSNFTEGISPSAYTGRNNSDRFESLSIAMRNRYDLYRQRVLRMISSLEDEYNRIISINTSFSNCCECPSKSVVGRWESCSLNSIESCYVTPRNTSINNMSHNTLKELTAINTASRKVWNSFFTNPEQSWTYVGLSSSGVAAMAPHTPITFGGKNSCGMYDPRLRPWYTECLTSQKVVTIIIDVTKSGTPEVFLKPIFSTLGLRDKIKLYFLDGNVIKSPQECYEHATDPVKKRLDDIASMTHSSGQFTHSDIGVALTEVSREVLRSTLIILFISSSQSDIPSFRTTPPAVGHKVVIHIIEEAIPFFLTESEYGLLSSKTVVVNQLTVDSMPVVPGLYSQLPSLQRLQTEPFLVAPYADIATGDIVSSMVSHFNFGNNVGGVVGIDVALDDLVGDLKYSSDRGYYSFLFEGSSGQIVWHPGLTRIEGVGTSAAFLKGLLVSEMEGESIHNIVTSEQSGSVRVDAKTVILSSNLHSATLLSQVVDVDVQWGVLDGSFSLATIALVTSSVPDSLLHQSEAAIRDEMCTSFLNRTCNDSEKSIVILREGSFIKTSLQMYSFESEAIQLELENEIQLGIQPKLLHQSALNDIRLTSIADVCWYDRPGWSVSRHMSMRSGIERYLLTERGKLKQVSQSYSEYNSMLYDAVNTNKTVVSYNPNTRLYSISKHLNYIYGSVTTDYVFDDFKQLMFKYTECSPSHSPTCLVVNSAGSILLSSGSVGGDRRLANSYPSVFVTLHSNSHLQLITCRDIAASIVMTSYEIVISEEVEYSLVGSCSKFSMSPINETDLFLIKISGDSSCSSLKCIPCSDSSCSTQSDQIPTCYPCECYLSPRTCNAAVRTFIPFCPVSQKEPLFCRNNDFVSSSSNSFSIPVVVIIVVILWSVIT